MLWHPENDLIGLPMGSHDQGLSAARSGDWLEVRGISDSPSQRGEIVNVLGTTEHPHFLVRWDEGHESIVYPTDHGAIVHRPASAEGRLA